MLSRERERERERSLLTIKEMTEGREMYLNPTQLGPTAQERWVLESVRCHNSLRFDRWQRPGDARNSFFLDATVLSHSDVEELERINSKRHSFCTTPPLINVFFIDVEELERIKKK